MGTAITVIIVILVILVILALIGMSAYNGFVKSRNVIQESWRQVDVELNRRYDLIPNLAIDLINRPFCGVADPMTVIRVAMALALAGVLGVTWKIHRLLNDKPNAFVLLAPAMSFNIVTGMGEESLATHAAPVEADERAFEPTEVTYRYDGGLVSQVGGPGSHLVAHLARANCLVVVPEHVTELPEGAEVDVVLIEGALQ